MGLDLTGLGFRIDLGAFIGTELCAEQLAFEELDLCFVVKALLAQVVMEAIAKVPLHVIELMTQILVAGAIGVDAAIQKAVDRTGT